VAGRTHVAEESHAVADADNTVVALVLDLVADCYFLARSSFFVALFMR
jgi:hypothetical protein